MSRYAYIHTQIWKDKKFRQLGESSKMLYIAMLTAPSSNMIGLYEWPVAYALHDLGDWDEQKFFSCLAEIEEQGLACYDRENEVVFIRGFLKHNPLKSVKQVAGGAKYFQALPSSPLLHEFARAWQEFVDAPFRKSLEGREDENAQKSLREADRIAGEIQNRLYPMDTLSNAYPFPIDNPVPEQVHGHGQIPEPKDDSADADTAGIETCEAGNAQKHETETGDDTSLALFPEKPATLGKVLALWNDTLGPLGFFQVKKVTPARERAFKARINTSTERRDLEWWREVIGRLALSNFMRDSAKNKANWLTFDWLLNENNIVKVLEGKYDNDRLHVIPSTGKQEQPVIRPLSYEESMARFERRHGGGIRVDVIDVEAREENRNDKTGPRCLPETHGQGGACHSLAEWPGL